MAIFKMKSSKVPAGLRLPLLGYRIFLWLLGFSLVLLLGLFVYAYCTYPDSDQILKSSEFPQGTTFPQRLDTLNAEREVWTNSVKDLGTQFLVTPIFSLLSAIVGYIFGVSRQTTEAEEPSTTTEATTEKPTPEPHRRGLVPFVRDLLFADPPAGAREQETKPGGGTEGQKKEAATQKGAAASTGGEQTPNSWIRLDA